MTDSIMTVDVAGNTFWMMDGCRHREDGPAVTDIYGNKAWYKHGKTHRIDGPAVEWNSGCHKWYINGRSMKNQKVFQSKSGLSDEEMVVLILKYGEIE